MKRFLSLILSCLLFCGISIAASPGQIIYLKDYVRKAGDTMTGTLTNSANVIVSGNIGIGTTEPLAKLSVSNGDISIEGAGKYYGDGSSLTGVAANTANYAILSGTASIAGYAILSGTASTCSGNASTADYATLSGTATNAGYAILSGTSSACSGAASLNVLKTGDKMTGVLTTETSVHLATLGGNVGIGTTEPGSKLEVAQSSAISGLKIYGYDTHASDYGEFYVNSSGTYVANSLQNLLFTSVGGSIYLRGNPIFLNDTNSNKVILANGGGNVGIGTAEPVALLSFPLKTTAAGGINFGGDTNLYRSTADVLKTDDNLDVGLDYIRIHGSNFVTWGPIRLWGASGNTPTTPVLSFTGDQDTGFYNPSDNIIGFSIGGVEKVRFAADGNVGIGTTNPTRTLEVTGIVKATSFEGSGAALTDITGTDSTKVLKTGDTMTGKLTVPTLEVTTTASIGLATSTVPQLTVNGGSGGGTVFKLNRTDGTVASASWALPAGKLSFLGTNNYVMTQLVEGSGSTPHTFYLGSQGLSGYSGFNSKLAATVLEVADGADKAGANFTFQSGLGTGTNETGGNFYWATASPEVSGTTIQSAVNRMTLKRNGNLGIGTTSPEFKLTLNNDGGILAQGIWEAGTILTTTGESTRLIWYPRKGAFRAGQIDNEQPTYWDNANIGEISFAGGCDTKASGSVSTALGIGTVASGDLGATALGYHTAASGFQGATALGCITTAEGDYGSTAIGYRATANSDYSIAIGRNITVGTVANIGSSSVGINVNSNEAIVTAPNVIVLTGGNVGIGTTEPTSSLTVAGTITTNGGQILKHKTVNLNAYTALETDYIIGMDTIEASTVTLPLTPGITVEGRSYIIKDEGNNDILITGEAGTKINGVTTGFTMTVNGSAATLYYGGAAKGWYINSVYTP